MAREKECYRDNLERIADFSLSFEKLFLLEKAWCEGRFERILEKRK